MSGTIVYTPQNRQQQVITCDGNSIFDDATIGQISIRKSVGREPGSSECIDELDMVGMAVLLQIRMEQTRSCGLIEYGNC
jgi:hypothetical protein